MEILFTYLWQSAVVLMVLYIPFQLLLRKEHYFALNRAILLSVILLCLILPLSNHTTPSFMEPWFHPAAAEMLVDFQLGKGQIVDDDALLNGGFLLDDSSWIEANWRGLIVAIWVIGTICFVLWQIRGIWRLMRMLNNSNDVVEMMSDGIRLHVTTEDIPSFSWMNSIVISADDYSETGETIVAHERAHIAYRHSLDRLLLLIVQVLQWWNPFVWLLTDALSQVHEYQADMAVIKQGINATQYQLLLIRKAAGPAGLALINGFKHNKLKLRIVMMNNMINLRGAKCRYLALLPMVLLAVACTSKSEEKQAIVAEETAAVAAEEVNAAENNVEEEVFSVVEVQPVFPGGEIEMMNYLRRELRYPAECAEKKIQGRVMLSFVVEKDGSVSSVEELRSPNELLTKEAIRVVESMPKWEPGRQRNEPVRTKFIIPVTFRLQ